MPTAIEFDNISKEYRLGLVSTRTLSHDLNRWWKTKILRKEDPYLKIGEVNDRAHKGESDYVWALKDINLKVEQGEVLGIIGKNGAGKSTLLKILSRVTSPTTGTIRARGRIASLLEVGTGFHPEMTGRENIYMNGAILGMTKKEIDRKLDEIVDFSGVERYIDTPVKRYSSGMTVRLGFAIAAHLEPEILVVDEVLAVGDAEFQKKAIGKMQDVSKGDGRTVLFVSHNMTAVNNLCKNGIILKDGYINYAGKIDDVIDKYIKEQEIRSEIKISELKERQGNGIIKFIDIELLDKNGIKKSIFEVGEELIIKIYIETNELFKKCTTSRIDIGINDIYNNRATWLSTYLYNEKLNLVNNTISFRIPKLLLNEGIYNLNLYCETNLGIADWVQNIIRLNVVFNDFFKTGKSIPQKQGNFVTEFTLI